MNDLTNDISNIVNWGKQWSVLFNRSKTKLVSFHHHRDSPELPAIIMNGVPLVEQETFDRLLGLKFTPHLTMEIIYCWRFQGCVTKYRFLLPIPELSNSWGYFVPLQKPNYTYLVTLLPCRCSPPDRRWAGFSMSTLSVLDRLQNRIRNLVGDQLFSTLQPPLVIVEMWLAFPFYIATPMGNAPPS